MNLEQKQRFQNLIFPKKITYKNGKFGTAEIALIYQLIEQSAHQKVCMVPPRGIAESSDSAPGRMTGRTP